MNTLYYMDYHPNWFVNWCIQKYGPKRWIEFDVIDSKDSTKLTSFTLIFNGTETTYEVTANNNIKLYVPELISFTIQITNCEGYIDGVSNTYTAVLLKGAHIGMTKRAVETDNAEFKLDWNIEVSQDLDSHMVIKNTEGEEIGHVAYYEQTFEDATTK